MAVPFPSGAGNVPALRKITPLTKQQAVGIAEVQRLVIEARAEVSARIRAITQRAALSKSAAEREKLYAQIAAINDDLAKKIDGWLADMAWEVAPAWHDQAISDIRADGGTDVLKFDKRRVDTYLKMIHPDNDQQLAAVFTKKMSQQDIGALRQTVVEVFRQSSVSNMTANEIQKALQQRWNDVAGSVEFERFVDASGKVWPNSRYFQMLIRTTVARVARESYNDTLVQAGDDLVQIQSVGDSCPTCEAWDGVIVSISGSNPKFPSYQQALDAGMFHPNCDCLTRRVDEKLDAAEVQKQGGIQNPDFANIDQMGQSQRAAVAKAYRDAINSQAPVERRDVATTEKRAGNPDLLPASTNATSRIQFSDPMPGELGIKVEQVRQEIYALKREMFILLDKAGKEVVERHESGLHGGYVPDYMLKHLAGNIFVHNHPSGTLPGSRGYPYSFSKADILTLYSSKMDRIVVAGNKRSYIMEPGAAPLTGDEIRRAYRSAKANVLGKMRARIGRQTQRKLLYEWAVDDMIWKKISKRLGMKYTVVRHGR